MFEGENAQRLERSLLAGRVGSSLPEGLGTRGRQPLRNGDRRSGRRGDQVEQGAAWDREEIESTFVRGDQSASGSLASSLCHRPILE